MKQYLTLHPWKIIEDGFHPQQQEVSESVFSLGNGRMGHRANFEETYSGPSLPGSYVAGIYYPDKTRVGWWKNGYPEYFAKVLNAPAWTGVLVTIDGQVLDLAKCPVTNFRRELDMQTGILTRTFQATLADGLKIDIQTRRFCSMDNPEIGAIAYSLTPVGFAGTATVVLPVDGDVENRDANYGEKFWEEVDQQTDEHSAIVTVATRKTGFHVTTGMCYDIAAKGYTPQIQVQHAAHPKYAAHTLQIPLQADCTVTIYKYAAILSSENHAREDLVPHCRTVLAQAWATGFEGLRETHQAAWAQKWALGDITIEGDVAAQQGIRFNIFQLMQTYTGEDERLNIGPKGFTGEKYGGSTYWDTEAYCLPFYLGTASPQVARNLLIYRYKHLPKAIENAARLGFQNGAALYPMVTMNGDECHNEWEITFEEIHRNGAIAYAIYNYIQYTGDDAYLAQYGLEVLIALARFWAQRVNWSAQKEQYVILGVTGPNEYENNVHNNWYTNTIAAWSLRYTLQAINLVQTHHPAQYQTIVAATHLDEATETKQWQHMVDHMYYPYDAERRVFLQQDGFLDKPLLTVDDLTPGDVPLNQNWSWDRILRSCFIKQADVLQGLYFFEDRFDESTLRRNFDFYEPMTVHESSLSPCVHVILASRIGYHLKAYELYVRTARLDLDNYNHDTEEGCHITSMAGTWMSIVKGFGGMRVWNGQLHINPFIPPQWQSYSFRLNFRARVLKITVSHQATEIALERGEPLEILLHNKSLYIQPATCP